MPLTLTRLSTTSGVARLMLLVCVGCTTCETGECVAHCYH